jgi:hypothetical protein
MSLNIVSWGSNPVSSPDRVYLDMNLRKMQRLSLAGLANLVYDLIAGGTLLDPSANVWDDADVIAFEGPPVVVPENDSDWRIALCVAQRILGSSLVEPDTNTFPTRREGWPYEAILILIAGL